MDYPVRQLALHEFPPLVREITDPPKQLYARGQLPSFDRKWLAVVGSREATRYGIDACKTLIAGLRGLPVVIVSGLALGIDSVAHRAALEAGLPTVAVPGSGLSDKALYPRMHIELAREILESGGALLSELGPEERAAQWTFPKRNRIMAGLSHAILVIEATQKSGTLITARLAAEYNRDLLCVMGPIFSETSFGPHLFMKLGATPVRTADDIVEMLGLERDQADAPAPPELTAEETRVFELLREPLARDELIRMLGILTQDANVLLATMELKGVLSESLGKIRRV